MISESELKAQCWDIVYPALIFFKESGALPPSAAEDLARAVKHYNETETEDRES